MLANTDRRSFDVIEITNEMPLNRCGGVGTVVEALMAGLGDDGLRVLWFLMDHAYRSAQVRGVLERYAYVAVGSARDLRSIHAPLVHLHSYQKNAEIRKALANRTVVCTIHSLVALEERSTKWDWMVRWPYSTPQVGLELRPGVERQVIRQVVHHEIGEFRHVTWSLSGPRYRSLAQASSRHVLDAGGTRRFPSSACNRCPAMSSKGP